MRKLKTILIGIFLWLIGTPFNASTQLFAFQNAFETKKYDSALYYYEQAVIQDSNEARPFFIQYLSIHAIKGNYAKVYDTLQSYMVTERLPPYLKEKAEALYGICSYAKRAKPSTEISITNLGDSINSKAAEYFPYINFQDSLFIFMRRENWQREDFYYSLLNGATFSKAHILKDSINLPNKKGSASISKDGNTMYYAADYANMGYGRYDIYTVFKTNKGWSSPKNAGRNINTDFWESAPSISADGQSLYFCSNRPDGYGGIDIYVSHKNEKGFWDEAANLGPNINTAGDEQTPFIHPDNHSLYFASSGWPGFGGSDLFVSKLDKAGTWTKPINLGYPINTYDNEGSICVSSNGVEAYIASDRADSRGGLDIYKIQLAPNTRAGWEMIPKQMQTFQNVLFESNEANLKTIPLELEALANYLINHPSLHILIEGHTDNIGTAINNQTLSTNRAIAIQNYLITKGILSNRIKAIGWGSSQPIASNLTEAGRALNRRTNFTIQE